MGRLSQVPQNAAAGILGRGGACDHAAFPDVLEVFVPLTHLLTNRKHLEKVSSWYPKSSSGISCASAAWFAAAWYCLLIAAWLLQPSFDSHPLPAQQAIPTWRCC